MAVKKKAATKKKTGAKKKAPLKKKAVVKKKAARKKKKAPKKATLSKEQVIDIVCGFLMSSGKSLEKICNDNAYLPTARTIYRWLDDDEEDKNGGSLCQQYARAREAQADFLAGEIIEIADDGINDTYLDAEGNKVTDHDVIARSRLRVDARKWAASKLDPKRYGNNIDITGDAISKVIMVDIVDLTGKGGDG